MSISVSFDLLIIFSLNILPNMSVLADSNVILLLEMYHFVIQGALNLCNVLQLKCI